MEQLNAYFTVEWQGKNGICHLFPPKEGGVFIDYKDISAFLNRVGFEKFDSKKLNSALVTNNEETVELGEGDGLEFAASIVSDMTADHMQCSIRLYPPSTKGSKLTVKDIMGELNARGVRTGVDQNVIMDIVSHPVYMTDIIIAEGKAPIQGHDAYIEYFFNTDVNTKPQLNEDGSVDFHNLDTIAHIIKGQKLAELHKEDPGTPGFDVNGKQIAPARVKPCIIPRGKNYTISEDGLIATADVTGHANLINGQIFVSDIFEVPNDVDNSTGNIDYQGNIHIKGSVREGFIVNASGDIIIDGTIEGALVTAGGQIVVQRGINGMNKGVVEAHGPVITKFIENAKVFSKAYVSTGASINSEVSATNEVMVTEKKGFIAGGLVRAGNLIEAQTIGSAMTASTRLEVGGDPAIADKFNRVKVELQEVTAEYNKIQPVVANYAQLIQAGKQLDEKNKQYYMSLLTALKSDQEKLERLQTEYKVLEKKVLSVKNAKIKVNKDIYPGVVVVMSGTMLNIKTKRSYCYLEKKDADIVINNL